MKTYNIDVTQGDIDKGEQGRCQICPVALAAKRSIKFPVVVDGDDIFIYERCIGVVVDRFKTSAKLPKNARDFIKLFDQLGPRFVSPFSFALDLDL